MKYLVLNIIRDIMGKKLTYDELKKKFEEANTKFLNNNKVIIKRYLSERCLCANLAYELRDVFKECGYNDIYVDVEYNRDEYNIKKIYSYIHNKCKNIVCDLIVHDRNDNNYLALEMKKIPEDNESTNKDRERLEILTNKDHYCYEIGIFYELSIDDGRIEICYYKDGKMIETNKYNVLL